MSSSPLNRLRVRCLGGFEVWHEQRQVDGFESQKVRALLAYLVCEQERGFTREHLAGLLWPEKREHAARRNLRQAVYNLKSAFGTSGVPLPPVTSRQGRLQLNPEIAYWSDVAALEEALQRGTAAGRTDPHSLAGAVRLYQGEFLGDFPLKGNSDFEYWLLAERERLREAIVSALRLLIDSYLSRGESRLGIQYARRLVTLDPLSEEAHRYLMRLFAQAGRRTRALAQYQELQILLQRELEVEPLEETTKLYQAILAEKSPLPLDGEDREPTGPLIPLVGRSKAMDKLKHDWNAVRAGDFRISVVQGEAGVGKSRLTRSFLDAASSQLPCTVLMGNCVEGFPSAFQPFPVLLRNAVDGAERVDTALTRLDSESLEDLALFVPELLELRPDLGADVASWGGTRARLFDAVANFLAALALDEKDRREPLILHLDDVQWASRETFELIVHLQRRLAELPVWIVVTGRHDRSSTIPSAEAQLHAAGLDPGSLTTLPLTRLAPESVHEIAAWLVGAEHSQALAQLLVDGEGLPLYLAETINYLWDEGLLVAEDSGAWHLRAAEVKLPEEPALESMIARRLQRLPASTRRLATMAAVIGRDFHPDLVRLAADEHIAVVEIGIEILLERWMIRQSVDRWASARRERDIVQWARGSRRGRFDFSHKLTRDAVYHRITPPRLASLHRQVAAALEKTYEDHLDRACEQLAYHHARAGDDERAFVFVRQAALRARAMEALETAAASDDLLQALLERLIAGARDEEEARYWRSAWKPAGDRGR